MNSRALSVEAAREMVFSRAERLPAEEVSLLDALGRVLAQDVTSDIDVSPFDNSAMDGFAVRAEDLDGASPAAPRTLRVIAVIAAGDDVTGITVGASEAARIMTGAAIPQGTDTVVMVERSRLISGGGGAGSQVAFEFAPRLGEHVRRRGEEVAAGETVLREGEVVTPAAVGLLAATGHIAVHAYRRPVVGVISTGSELVDVTENPGPGKIRNSNSYSISAQVIAAGCVPVRYGIVRDDIETTRAAFGKAAQECDFVVTSGGVSVGDFDHVGMVLQQLGDMVFCKVDMRPGNPQTLGTIRGVPFFALPGNPTSAYVGFEIFVRPALRLMQGYAALDRPRTTARLAADINKKQDRRFYLRGLVKADPSGEMVASLSGSQSSALLTAAHRGNCLIVLPEGTGVFPAGSEVECMRLDMEEGAA